MTAILLTLLYNTPTISLSKLMQHVRRYQVACMAVLHADVNVTYLHRDTSLVYPHGRCRSRSQSYPHPHEEAGQVVTTPQEAIVPGLDFCNHSEASTARWTIFGAPGLQVCSMSSRSDLPVNASLVVMHQKKLFVLFLAHRLSQCK